MHRRYGGMAEGSRVLGLLLFLFAVALTAQAQTDYEKLTSKYRISHCKNRIEIIRDRMRPGMQPSPGSLSKYRRHSNGTVSTV